MVKVNQGAWGIIILIGGVVSIFFSLEVPIKLLFSSCFFKKTKTRQDEVEE
jgi:hypothetical protein